MMKSRMVMGLVAGVALAGLAETYTWKGPATGGDWDSSANWTPSGVPTGGDTALFTATATIASNFSTGTDAAKTLTVKLQPPSDVAVQTVTLSGVVSGAGGLSLLPIRTGSNPVHYHAIKVTGTANTFTGQFSAVNDRSVGEVYINTVADYGVASSIGMGTVGVPVLFDDSYKMYLTESGTYTTDRDYRFNGEQFNLMSGVDVSFTGNITGNMYIRSAGIARIRSAVTNAATVFNKTDPCSYYFYSPENVFTASLNANVGHIYVDAVADQGVTCTAGKGTQIALGANNETSAAIHFNFLETGDDTDTDRNVPITFCDKPGFVTDAVYANYSKSIYSGVAGRKAILRGTVKIANVGSALRPYLILRGPGDGDIVNGIASTTDSPWQLQLDKMDAGTWDLGGENNFGGTRTAYGTSSINVKQGRLNVNGSTREDCPVNVSAGGAVLGGTGTVHGVTTVYNGCTLAAGRETTVGTLTFDNPSETAGLHFMDGARLKVVIDAATHVASLIDARAAKVRLDGPVAVSVEMSDGSAVVPGSYEFLRAASLVGNIFVAEDDACLVSTSGGVCTIRVGSLDNKLTWNGGASGVWNKSAACWLKGGEPAAFADDDIVEIDAATATTITIGEDVRPLRVFVKGAGDVTFAGSAGLKGELTFIKSGSGTLEIANVNRFTGQMNVEEGTLRLSGTLEDANLAVLDSAALEETATGVIAGDDIEVQLGRGAHVYGGTNTFKGTVVFEPRTAVAASFFMPPEPFLSCDRLVLNLPTSKMLSLCASNSVNYSAAASNKVMEIHGSGNFEFKGVGYTGYKDFRWPGKILIPDGTTIGSFNICTQDGYFRYYLGTRGQVAIEHLGGPGTLSVPILRGAYNRYFYGSVYMPHSKFEVIDTFKDYWYGGGTLGTYLDNYGSTYVMANDGLPTNCNYQCGRSGLTYGYNHGNTLYLGSFVQHFDSINEIYVHEGGNRNIEGNTGSRLVIKGTTRDSSFGSWGTYRSVINGGKTTYVYDENGTLGAGSCMKGAMGLELAGTRRFDLNVSTNTFTGPVIVSGTGTLAANGPWVLGKGTETAEKGKENKLLQVTNGTLELNIAQEGCTGARLDLGAKDGTAGTVALAEGVNQTVKYFTVGDRYLAAGVYGGADSAAPKKLGCFSGTGTLTVTQCPTGITITFR